MQDCLPLSKVGLNSGVVLMPEQAKLITAQHEAILDAMIDERFRKAKKNLKEHILYVRDVHKRTKH